MMTKNFAASNYLALTPVYILHSCQYGRFWYKKILNLNSQIKVILAVLIPRFIFGRFIWVETRKTIFKECAKMSEMVSQDLSYSVATFVAVENMNAVSNHSILWPKLDYIHVGSSAVEI